MCRRSLALHSSGKLLNPNLIVPTNSTPRLCVSAVIFTTARFSQMLAGSGLEAWMECVESPAGLGFAHGRGEAQGPAE